MTGLDSVTEVVIKTKALKCGGTDVNQHSALWVHLNDTDVTGRFADFPVNANDSGKSTFAYLHFINGSWIRLEAPDGNADNAISSPVTCRCSSTLRQPATKLKLKLNPIVDYRPATGAIEAWVR